MGDANSMNTHSVETEIATVEVRTVDTATRTIMIIEMTLDTIIGPQIMIMIIIPPADSRNHAVGVEAQNMVHQEVIIAVHYAQLGVRTAPVVAKLTILPQCVNPG